MKILALWDFNDVPASEARFRTAAQVAPNSQALAEYMTQVARCRGLQRDFDEAHRILNEAQALLPTTESRAGVRVLLERGRVFNSSKKPEEARPLFQLAFDIASRLREEYLAVDAAHMLAIVSVEDEALAWNEKALSMASEAKDPDCARWIPSLLNNLGWTYFDKGEYAKALDLFQQAVPLREALGQEAEARVARWCVAKCLRMLGRFEEAMEAQLALATGSHDGYVDEELGECCLSLGKPSAKHFVAAYEKLSHDVANEPARLERLRNLGQESATCV